MVFLKRKMASYWSAALIIKNAFLLFMKMVWRNVLWRKLTLKVKQISGSQYPVTYSRSGYLSLAEMFYGLKNSRKALTAAEAITTANSVSKAVTVKYTRS